MKNEEFSLSGVGSRDRLLEMRAELLADAEASLDRSDDDNNDGIAFEEIQRRVALIDERIAKLDTIARAASNESNRVSGDGSVKPFEHMRRVDADDESLPMRDRALKGAESMRFADNINREASRERITCLVEDAPAEHRNEMAGHIVDASSPAYMSAMLKKLRNPLDAALMMTAEEREAYGKVNLRTYMSEGSSSVGAALLPTQLDPTIILVNDGAIDPFRGIATVRQCYTDSLNLITSAGVTSSWGSENTEMGDASPSVSAVNIPVHRAEAFIAASWELIEDSSIGMEISGLIAESRARLESAAHATGSGSGQPQGVITALAGVTASRITGSSGAAGTADLVLADCYAMMSSLAARYRPNASWVGENSTFLKIRSLGTGTNAGANFWNDLAGPALYPTLLGKPVYESSDFDGVITSGSTDNVLVLSDARQLYTIVDRAGLRVQFVNSLVGNSHRPTSTGGWVASWRTGAKVVNAAAGRLLQL